MPHRRRLRIPHHSHTGEWSHAAAADGAATPPDMTDDAGETPACQMPQPQPIHQPIQPAHKPRPTRHHTTQLLHSSLRQETENPTQERGQTQSIADRKQPRHAPTIIAVQKRHTDRPAATTDPHHTACGDQATRQSHTNAADRAESSKLAQTLVEIAENTIIKLNDKSG